MGHHRSPKYSSSFSNQPVFQDEKLRLFIRKNRKKILIMLALMAVIIFLVVIFIGYVILSVLSNGKDVVLNQQTLNQAQKITSGGAKLIPENLPNNGLLQNLQWIINIINTLQSFGG